MLTTPTARKSEKLWPSLSSVDGPSTSFFGDQKVIHVTGNKAMMATPQISKAAPDDEEGEFDDDPEFKVPDRLQLGDCLATALAKSASLKEAPKSNGKKKKTKKTLLFASGMNFN